MPANLAGFKRFHRLTKRCKQRLTALPSWAGCLLLHYRGCQRPSQQSLPEHPPVGKDMSTSHRHLNCSELRHAYRDVHLEGQRSASLIAGVEHGVVACQASPVVAPAIAPAHDRSWPLDAVQLCTLSQTLPSQACANKQSITLSASPLRVPCQCPPSHRNTGCHWLQMTAQRTGVLTLPQLVPRAPCVVLGLQGGHVS